MRHLRHSHPPALWHLLLMLIVVQGVFVALELGREAGHVIDGEDALHLVLPELPPLELSAAPYADQTDSASTVPGDSCDHCCLCHGHGSHAATINGSLMPDFPPYKSEPIADYPSFSGKHPDSIYRPPIA